MTKKNAAKTLDKSPRNEPNLDSRYGQIGISAVVAALQYKSEAKNPAYAPAAPRLDKFSEETAEIAA
jgi:hypothetical protein